MEVKWNEWCRLCARGDSGSQNIDVGSDSNSNGTQSISTAIGKYFWVNIKPTDVNKFLCQDCYALINMLIGFTERVNKVQAMFLMLQSTKTGQLDPFEVRSQFDLLDEDWEHIIKIDRKSNFLDFDHEVESIEVDDKLELNDAEVNSKESETFEHFATSSTNFNDDSESDETTYNKEFLEDEVINIAVEEDLEPEKENDKLKRVEKENAVLEEEVIHVENDEQAVLPRIKRKQAHSDYEQSPTKSKLVKVADESEEIGNLQNTPKYQCKKCGKNYKNAASYRKHLDSHNLASDLPDFMCEECGKVLATEKQLIQHKRTHLPLEEKLTVACPHCDKKYVSEAVMKHHVIHMHNEQSYVCDECGMTLKRLTYLKEHKLTHINVLAFKCETCDKGFKNKARLKAHIDAVHSTTSYPCSECELILNSKRTLKMHMLVHTNKKEYKCNFCGAEFKRGKSLKNHLIIHIGLRPYKCNFCEKTFTNGSNCRAHKRKIHPIELEAEEAAGLKNQSTVVPNLYELRASESIQEPRSSHRNRGGITPKMRALLVAAEQLESSLPNSDKKRMKQFKFNNESSEYQEVTELVAESNTQNLEHEIESKTYVFEVINEIDL